ncbi:MAG: zinc-dependent metalloprotease [Acidimicrobiia bacterium]
MSDVPPSFPGFGPFPGFDLTQVFKLLESQGPVNWQIAGQTASWVAREGGGEDPSPADVTRLGDVARAAQAHLSAALGRPELGDVPVRVLGREAWSQSNLNELRAVLEVMASAMTPPPPPEMAGDPFSKALGGVVPMLLGGQFGYLFGQLAKEILGQHDLLLPWSGPPVIAFVHPNLVAFAQDWDLPIDDVEFVVALHEAAHAALSGVDWIRRYLADAVGDHAGGFSLDQAGLQAGFGSFDPSDPSSLQDLMKSPESLLAAMESPVQQAARARFRNLGIVIEGVADQFAGEVARTMLPGADRVYEALHRRLGDVGEAGRFVRRMLGIMLAPGDRELGRLFCSGVVERAGSGPLLALLDREELLPRLSELEAPGLWLARIEVEGDLPS